MLHTIFRQIQAYLSSWLVYTGYVLGIFSHINNVRHIQAYLPTCGYISASSGMFRILTQLNIFMYINAYSETMAYSGKLKDIFSQFQAHYSGITQELSNFKVYVLRQPICAGEVSVVIVMYK